MIIIVNPGGQDTHHHHHHGHDTHHCQPWWSGSEVDGLSRGEDHHDDRKNRRVNNSKKGFVIDHSHCHCQYRQILVNHRKSDINTQVCAIENNLPYYDNNNIL